MSVTLRGKKFHYRFQVAGVDYHGVCENCATSESAGPKEIAVARKKALQYEESVRAKILADLAEQKSIEADIRKNRTVRALVENYRYELTGAAPMTLAEAITVAESKPSARKVSVKFAAARKVYWADYAAFMAATYPDVTDVAQVRRAHCDAYVRYLVDHGRFVKEVRYDLARGKRAKSVTYTIDRGVSPKTVKAIASVCSWVFTRVAEDAGLLGNPWANVVLPAKDPIDREVFTPEELRLIWNGLRSDPFCFPLFVVAANSGMTEGDICTLEWSDIDWSAKYVRRRRRKTGAPISLPMIPELIDFLGALPQQGKYIFPTHAAMYLRQQSSVSERVMDFLHGLGIKTSVEVPGRRAVSIKDLHSLRHVFCYRAKKAGIPESVIAKFVGHKVIAMTRHYADHDSDEELRAEIQKLSPLFVGEVKVLNEDTEARAQLTQLAQTLPISEVQRLLALAKTRPAPCAQLPCPAPALPCALLPALP